MFPPTSSDMQQITCPAYNECGTAEPKLNTTTFPHTPTPTSQPHCHTITAPTHSHTHTRLTALCPGLPESAGTRKVKPVRIFLLKQETVSGSGISWAICKSAPRSKQITTPATHHSCHQLYEKTSGMQRLTSFVVSCSSVSVMRTFGMVLTLPLRGLIIYALYTDPADTDRT